MQVIQVGNTSYKIQSDPIISTCLQRSNQKSSNNKNQMSLAIVMMASGELATLNNNNFVVIANLKLQSKRAYIDSIHARISTYYKHSIFRRDH